MLVRDTPVSIWSRTRDFSGVNVTTSYQLRKKKKLVPGFQKPTATWEKPFSGALTPSEKAKMHFLNALSSV